MNLSPETIREEAKGEAGRKSKYSLKKVREICKHVLRGIPLRYASPLCGIPFGTAKGWLAEHPEMGEMLEEAHGKFVQNHVGNIERHSRMSEKPSQWLLERRAKQEFAPAYTTEGKAGSTLNVLALGDDALGKLMSGWVGMMEGKSEQSQVIDLTPESNQIPSSLTSPTESEHNDVKIQAQAKQNSPPNLIEAGLSQQEKQAVPAEEVKQKRGRGRPRKYPKPDGLATPPTPPTPII